jgi:hypothetical protein
MKKTNCFAIPAFKARLQLFMLLLFSPFHWLAAQQIYTYNSPGSDCYSEMIFINQAILPKAVLVINAGGADLIAYSKTSVFSDSLLKKHYNLLFVNILNKNNSNSMICYDAIINTYHVTDRIEKSAFYVVYKPQNNSSVIIKKHDEPDYKFNTINYPEGEITEFVQALDNATLNQPYFIPIQSIVNYEMQFNSRIKNYKFNHDIGLYFQPLFLTGDKLGINRKSITTFGLSYAYNFGQRHALKFSFGGSFKKPNTDAIQSSLQSKVQTAVQNGDDFVYIDETLSGHVLFGGDISYRYYFSASKRFRPYASAGLGRYRLTYMEGRIQDTIDVSNIDMSNPSSMQDAISGGSTGEMTDGMLNRSSIFSTPQLEFGFEYRLSPMLKFNCALPFRYYYEKTTYGYSSFTWGLNLGLSLTINPGKLAQPVKPK